MEPVNVHIGSLASDRADYDGDGDVLYLHAGEPVGAEGEGDAGGPCGARPETIEASADEPAPALATA